METHWMIIFGIIGTCLALYSLFFTYLIDSHPRTVWEMNQIKPHYLRKRSDYLETGLMFICMALLIYGVYQIIYFLLGWMPSEWGGYDYDAEEWVTRRSALSATIGFWAGGFLCQAIGKGIKGRLIAAELQFEINLRNKIDLCLNKEQLLALKKKFEETLQNEVPRYFGKEGYEFLKHAQNEKIPPEAIKEILRPIIEIVNRKTSLFENIE